MAMKIPFRRKLDFTYGEVAQVAPGIRRIIAENPSPFTLYGTGTYIVGRGEVAVIDPGPADAAHIDRLLDGIAGETVSHIFVTHTHMDHSPGSRLLQERTGAKTYAYGPHGAGKLEQGVPVEEGGRHGVSARPTARRWGNSARRRLVPGVRLHPRPHLQPHVLPAAERKALFTGDHVMGWSTSIVSPPDGDMAAYIASLEKLLLRDDLVYWPTHGPSIEDPKPYVRAFITHRQERQEQVLVCVRQGVRRIEDMVPQIYAELPEFMYPAAARSVLASVVHLVELGRLRTDGEAQLAARYWLG